MSCVEEVIVARVFRSVAQRMVESPDDECGCCNAITRFGGQWASCAYDIFVKTFRPDLAKKYLYWWPMPNTGAALQERVLALLFVADMCEAGDRP